MSISDWQPLWGKIKVSHAPDFLHKKLTGIVGGKLNSRYLNKTHLFYFIYHATHSAHDDSAALAHRRYLTMSYQITEIDDIGKFKAVKEEWNYLLSTTDCDVPFLRHEWLTVWWDHFGKDRKLAIFLAWKGESLVLAAPLMEIRSRWPWITSLQSITNHHSNRSHLLLAPEHNQAIPVFFNFLKKRQSRWDYILLQEMEAESKGVNELIKSAQSANFRADVWVRGESPYIPISTSWNDYFQSLKPKFRSNLRNRTKRLAARGTVTHEVIVDANQVDSALVKGFAIENKGWKGSANTAIASDPLVTSFYSEIARVAAIRKWLRISFLRVGEKFVAFDYSLSYKKRVYCLKIGYDPEYRPFSVGQLLCKENIKKCIDDGNASYEFLGESTIQKRDWTDATRRIVWLYIHNNSLRGRLHYIHKFVIKQKLNQLKRRKT